MLEILDLHVSVNGIEILKGVDLCVPKGEVHAIMGPNGSGKSTMANVIVGRPEYKVTKGEVKYQGKDLLSVTPDKRATEGIFLAFQYPVELPGVRFRQFMKSALDSKRKCNGHKELTAREFDSLYKEKIEVLGIDSELAKRSVNDGFSGGEKKRGEMLQLAILDPNLIILDETDSGLDIDALRSVSGFINSRRSVDRSMLIVTHYQRILNYITPDRVHVLIDGRVVKSGGSELALDLEKNGYEWITGDLDKNG